MKKIIIAIFMVLILINMLIPVIKMDNYNYGYETYAVADINNKKSSMYVWNIYNINYTALNEIVDYLNIDTFYIGNYNNLDDYKHTLMFEYAKENNLKTYLIYGENYEDQDKILIEIKNLIDKTVNYNENNKYKIDGIVIDSEFHTTSAYRNGDLETRIAIFRKYVDIMKEAYNYANINGLKFITCIPSNYDTNISIDLLEELISDCCDCVQIMNYTKKNSIVNIENEVNIAKKYNRKIESIAELQKPGEHGVTDNITFWLDGIDACVENLRGIEEAYQYDNLSFSYHAYTSVVELIKDVNDYNTYYDYELYPKDLDNNSLLIANLYLESDNEKIKGLNVYDKMTNKNIVYFYGVSYDKNYKLVDENKKYALEDNNIMFEQSDDFIKYDEKLFVDYVEDNKDIIDEEKPQENDNEQNDQDNHEDIKEEEKEPEEIKNEEEIKQDESLEETKKEEINKNNEIKNEIITIPEIKQEPVIVNNITNKVTNDITKEENKKEEIEEEKSENVVKEKEIEKNNTPKNDSLKNIIIVILIIALIYFIIKLCKLYKNNEI